MSVIPWYGSTLIRCATYLFLIINKKFPMSHLWNEVTKFDEKFVLTNNSPIVLI